jgi:hypothetical protein
MQQYKNGKSFKMKNKNQQNLSTLGSPQSSVLEQVILSHQLYARCPGHQWLRLKIGSAFSPWWVKQRCEGKAHNFLKCYSRQEEEPGFEHHISNNGR